MLASNVTANDFQDVAAFLQDGGQRGPQRQILREGTYAINLAQFIVITEEKVYYLPLNRAEEGVIQNMAKVIGERDGFRPVVLKDQDDKTGIVTVHDGPSLSPGEIIAPIVGGDPTNVETYHNNFQAPDRFLKAGGLRGRQLQVLVEGTYYLNRLFATVEMIPKTIIEIGTVGVVVFYTGEAGRDLSGDDYRHGELVETRPSRRVGRAAHAGQVRVQHLRRQGRAGPHDQRHPEVDPGPGRLAPLRREPGGDLVDHQGRLRAIAAAVGGHAHRLPQGSPGGPALRRRETAGRADPRPHGVGLLQEHRPDAHADPAHPGARQHPADFEPGDEGKVHAL